MEKEKSVEQESTSSLIMLGLKNLHGEISALNRDINCLFENSLIGSDVEKEEKSAPLPLHEVLGKTRESLDSARERIASVREKLSKLDY